MTQKTQKYNLKKTYAELITRKSPQLPTKEKLIGCTVSHLYVVTALSAISGSSIGLMQYFCL